MIDPDPGQVMAQAPTQQYGYIRCYRAVVRDCGISAAYLYGLLEDYAQLGARNGRGCMPSHDHLATLMGVHRNTVLGLMHKLREAGWVAWQEAEGQSHRYVLPARNLHRIRAGARAEPAQNPGRGCTETGHKQEQASKPEEQDVLPPTPLRGAAAVGSAEGQTKAKPRRRIPEDWALTPALRSYAEERGIPPAAVNDFAEEFRLYWLGDGRPKADWHAAFQARVREKAPGFAARNGRAHINDTIIQSPPQRDPARSPTPEEAAAARAEQEQRAARAAAEREARRLAEIERAAGDPRRPATVRPETWAGLTPAQREHYALPAEMRS